VDGPLSDEGRDNLNVLRRSADHLRALIDDILDLSALESGELELDVGPVDVFALAAEVVREARVTAEAKSLSIALAGEPASAWADARRVRQILGNLVGNAVKFTRSGGVTVSVGLAGDFASVAVSDTGPGIDPGQRAAIFEEYWQAPASRQSRIGTGLGLAITRRLVRMHGGTIELESEIGRGSKFIVGLPVVPGTSKGRFASSAPPAREPVSEEAR
jgi:signal transduction histidine kinase